MLPDIIDYLELDQMSEDELYNMKKEHKLRTLDSLKTVIYQNIHKYELAQIEEYRDYLLQQLDEEIDEISFYSVHTTYTYTEQQYKEFLNDYKDKLNYLFYEFLTVGVS